MSKKDLNSIASSVSQETIDKVKDLISEDSAPRKILNSVIEKKEEVFAVAEIGELFISDKSFDEKLADLKEVLGEDSPTGKILDLVEKLSKAEHLIIHTLNVAGDYGLPAEHLEGILTFKESS